MSSSVKDNPPQKRGLNASFLLWLVPGVFLLIFFLLPLAEIIRTAAKNTFSEGLNRINLQTIWQPLSFTIWQATISTLLTLILGLPAAFALSRFRFRGKFILRVLTTLPFILPTVVVAAGFNALLGPNGWLNSGLMGLFKLDTPPIQILNTFSAILLAHLFYNITIIIRVVGSAIEQMEVRLENAARVLGASPFQVMKEVTLPLLRVPILAAVLLVFLFNFTSFGVILMLGGAGLATLEVEIYKQALHMLNLPLAGLLSLIQLGCTLLVSIFYLRLTRKTTTQLTPRLYGEGTQSPRGCRQRLFLGITVFCLVLLIVLPLSALTLRSFNKLEANRGERGEVQTGWTLTYYQELFTNRRGSIFYVPPITAIRNSLLYATSTMLISVFLGTLAVYALNRRNKGSSVLDLLLMLPLGTSAVTLGLGYIIFFNRLPIDTRIYPVLIPLAHSLVALPFVVRSMQPAILAIPPSLRQAAAIQGASPWRVWREVDLPIILRAALVAAIFAFTISLGEFGATTFLARPEYPTMPVAIYRFLSQPGALNYGQAMAMATLLLATCGISIAALELLQKPGQKFL